MQFTSLYSNVLKYGVKAQTRAGKAQQILNGVCEAEFGSFPCRPGGNAAVGLVEGVQMIAGTAELAPLKHYAPRAKHELFGLSSYYGPRIAPQVPRVIAELLRSPATRRAVLYVGSGADNPDTIPCTNTIQFQQQYPGSVYLTLIANMRSSDLVYGMPYDIIQFSMLAHAVARCCNMVAREIVIQTGNAHIYKETAVPVDSWEQGRFTMPDVGDTWEDWVQWAQGLVHLEPLTRSQFLDVFQVKLPLKGGDANK